MLWGVIFQSQKCLRLFLIFWSKHNICITQKNVYLEICTCKNVTSSSCESIWRPSGLQPNVSTTSLCFCSDTVPLFSKSERVLLISITYYRSKRFFSTFKLLMSTWSDLICENTFETSHVRFIHENFSVLITTPLDQIQQNLLRKETCQTTAKPAVIVLQTWFEEYPTPP